MLDGNRAGLDDQAKRLYISSWLTRRARAAVGGPVPADVSPDGLVGVAAGLREGFERGPLGDVRFEPPYPGEVVEAATAAGTARLLLASTVSAGSHILGVAFTTLIAGRHPDVSVAPPGAAVKLETHDTG